MTVHIAWEHSQREVIFLKLNEKQKWKCYEEIKMLWGLWSFSVFHFYTYEGQTQELFVCTQCVYVRGGRISICNVFVFWILIKSGYKAENSLLTQSNSFSWCSCNELCKFTWNNKMKLWQNNAYIKVIIAHIFFTTTNVPDTPISSLYR